MVRICALALMVALVFCRGIRGNAGEEKVPVPEHVPPNMAWQITDDNLVVLRDFTDLRLNVDGGNVTAGKRFLLWGCQGQGHEMFAFDGTQIRLTANEDLCLNIEGGNNAGHRAVTFDCGVGDDITPNEEFMFNESAGMIQLKHAPELCLNVKSGRFEQGAEIILWPCADGTESELFNIEGNRISPHAAPEFHFNVAGAEITQPNQPIVLWTCDGAPNEFLEFADDGRIHLKLFPEFCLNAAGGLSAGHEVIVWPCQDPPQSNELWTYIEEVGAIVATKDPRLGLNAAGGSFHAGDAILVYPFVEHEEL